MKQNTIHLLPHDNKYVCVLFSPKCLDHYSAMFKATVVDGCDAKTKQLSFEIKGHGILPHVSVVTELETDEFSRKVLNLGRVFKNQHSRASFTLENTGTIHSNMSFEAKNVTDSSTDKSNSASDSAKQLQELRAKLTMFSFYVERSDTIDSDFPQKEKTELLGTTFSIEPAKRIKFYVEFHPTIAGLFDIQIALNIDQNPFENTIFLCKCSSYEQDIIVSSSNISTQIIPTKNDKIELVRSMNFGEMTLQATKRHKITLSNHSNSLYRFMGIVNQKNQELSIQMTPNIGHILANSQRDIILSLMCKQISVIKEAVNFKFEKIACKESSDANKEWDSSMMVIRTLTSEQYELEFGEKPQLIVNEDDSSKPDDGKKTKESKKKKKSSDKTNESVIKPQILDITSNGYVTFKTHIIEPEHDIIETGDPPGMDIDINAIVDEGQYECSVDEINFEPTFMFETSKRSFVIKNTCKISLEYSWNINHIISKKEATNTQQLQQQQHPFVIAPQHGTIKPEQEQTITITFHSDNPCHYHCELQPVISPLNEEQASTPLIIPVQCECVRPICYFNCKLHDFYHEYVESGKRKSNLPGPSGKIGESLPDSSQMRVLKCKSLGINAENVLRFDLLNTSNETIFFEWHQIRGSTGFKFASKLTGKLMPNQTCATLLHYTPKTGNLQESFWKFRIPSKAYEMLFLFVGTVIEPDIK